MAILTRAALKNLFRTAMKPFQADYWNWLDSYWHKNDKIPVSSVENLQHILDEMPYGVYRGSFAGGYLYIDFEVAMLNTIITMECEMAATVNVGIAGQDLEEIHLHEGKVHSHAINTFLAPGHTIILSGEVEKPVKFSIYQMRYTTV